MKTKIIDAMYAAGTCILFAGIGVMLALGI